MDIFGILTMVGGLALFLFGMNAMGQYRPERDVLLCKTMCGFAGGYV